MSSVHSSLVVEYLRGLVSPRNAASKPGAFIPILGKKLLSKTKTVASGYHSRSVGGQCCSLVESSAGQSGSVVARRLPSRVVLPRGLQVTKVGRLERVRQSLMQLRQGLCVSPGHDHFLTSHDRRPRDLREVGRPFKLPLGIAARSLQCVCCVLPGLNTLAVSAAPFPSRTGVIALPAAAVDRDLGEEHISRASVRLSQRAGLVGSHSQATDASGNSVRMVC